MLHGGQKETAKPAFVGMHFRQAVVGQQLREKSLRHVFSLMRRRAAAADKPIERIPISTAQGLEGATGLFRRRSRIQNDAPMRGLEHSSSRPTGEVIGHAER
jgi:hypothetical protein